jgi:hypothetical protein
LFFIRKLLNVLALLCDYSDELLVHLVDPGFEKFEDYSCSNFLRVCPDLDQPALLGAFREIVGAFGRSDFKRNVFERFLYPLGQGLLLTVDVVGSTQWESTFEDPAVKTTGAFFLDYLLYGGSRSAFLDPRRHFSHTGDACLQFFTLLIDTSELLLKRFFLFLKLFDVKAISHHFL